MGSVAIFAAVLFAVGGFIAWSGDRLGTWVGKKRLSKFGLRPKHTAMLYTIFSGSLIAVLTLGVLLSYDKDVTRALTQGRQIIADRNQAIRNYHVEVRQEQIAQQGYALAENQRKIAEFDRSIAESETRLADKKLVASQHNLGLADQSLNTARGELTVERESLDRTASELLAAQGSVQLANRTLVVTRQTLSAEQARVSVEQARVCADQNIVALLSSQEARLRQSNQKLVAANADLEKKNVSSYPLAEVIYHQDEPLPDRADIDTNQSAEDIRRALDAWLDKVGHTADQYGAATGANGRTVAVETVVTNTGNGRDIAAPEGDKLDLLADSIAAQKGIVSSVVVVAWARDNALVGEQVKLAVQAFDNVLVFNKGETIADTTIDGTGDAEDIYASLARFLSDDVRPVARSHNIMPTIDPRTREATYGNVIENWGDLVKQIQAIGASAHVYAVTARDTHTGDALLLHLKVQSTSGGAATPQSGAATMSGGSSSKPIAYIPSQSPVASQ